MSATDARFNGDRSCLLNVDKVPGNMRQSDLDHLAMLKARAKKESGNFGFVEFLQIALFIGITCAFTVAFYKIAMLERSVDSLERRHQMLTDTLHQQQQQQQPRPDPVDDHRSSAFDRMGFGGFGGYSRHSSSWERDNMRPRNYPEYKSPNRDSVVPPEVAGDPTTAAIIDDQGLDTPLTDLPNDETTTRNRSRRSVPDQPSAGQNNIETTSPQYEEHFARHLHPAETSMNFTKRTVFTWADAAGQDPALTRSGFELVAEQFLRAPVSGFYYLYSQVTYGDNVVRSIGHQMVRYGQCGSGKSDVMMSTSITQQHVSGSFGTQSQDSAYVGGVAYLTAGDLVAVRPQLGKTKVITITRSDKNTFFGGFLISKDNDAPPIEEICPAA